MSTGPIATLTIARTIEGAPRAWPIADPNEKLAWRGALAGASIYDRAAHTLRALQAAGMPARELLSLALPAGWMVNTKATSRAMKAWLAPPSIDAWSQLLDTLAFDLSPTGWLEMATSDRDAVARHVTALAEALPAEGTSLAAVSKVLALVRPQLVPLMDDAALWFALELGAEPQGADAPDVTQGPASAFTPMLDWFAEQVRAHEDELIAIAVRHDRAVLDAAQTLDRLVWFESWGQRLRAKAAQPPSTAGAP